MGKILELLAPAGNFDALKAVIDNGADAVYLGGKRFNMRMHRKDMNFDDEDLEMAVSYAHSNGVRIYVTLNNLYNQREIEDVAVYLEYLKAVAPDALIVQDLSVLKLLRDMDIDIQVHASVMMNVHNRETAMTLKELGVTRFVACREMDLKTLKKIKEDVGIEIEYFIHGDMCYAESGQCLTSGIVLGKSSNKGRCLKPCRWAYGLYRDNRLIRDGYLLAVKDMCMLPHIPQLAEAEVDSLKVEGRMRGAEYIGEIIGIYRRAIDGYMKDPAGWALDMEDYKRLYDKRAREFSTAFAFGNPGPSYVDETGRREPKIFTRSAREHHIEVSEASPFECGKDMSIPKLAVRVRDVDSAMAAIEAGAERIIIGGEAFCPARPFKKQDIKGLIEDSDRYGVEIGLAMPRITMNREILEYRELLRYLKDTPPDVVYVSNLGSYRLVREEADWSVCADYSFNIMNDITISLLKELGFGQATLSLEATFAELKEIKPIIPLELIVQGPIEGMVSDNCLLGSPYSCDKGCRDGGFYLKDETGGLRRVGVDQYCRNHIFLEAELCLLPYLKDVLSLPLASIRVEGRLYNADQVETVVGLYRKSIDSICNGGEFDWNDFKLLREAAGFNQGLGIFRFDEIKKRGNRSAELYRT